MSADNGIYILQTKDGCRVAHLQCIENLYWWHSCCKKPDVIEEHCDAEGADILINRCQNCGNGHPPSIEKDKICPKRLKEMFGHCKVFATRSKAIAEAVKIYDEIMKDDMGVGIVEYGIQRIDYDREFPSE